MRGSNTRSSAWACRQFSEELERRLGFRLSPARAFAFTDNGDRLGWAEGDDGTWHFTLFVENGRVRDLPDRRLLSGLHAIAELGVGRFIITPNQNLVLADIPAEQRGAVAALLEEHGLDAPVSGLRRNSLACVALPTCGLALAESERYLPSLVTRLEDELERLGLAQDDITIRMTGCPNGCARPYLSEIALVGRAPGLYNLYLGGAFDGTRLNKLYRKDVDDDAIVAALAPLLREYAERRSDGERFGDYVIRAGHVRADHCRQHVPRRSGPRPQELTMRQLLYATRDLAWPSLRHTEGRLLGLPFVLAACAPGLVSDWSVCIAALMIASVASFLVFVPLTALALNGGVALGDDQPPPPLTPRAYALLLAAVDGDRVAGGGAGVASRRAGLTGR